MKSGFIQWTAPNGVWPNPRLERAVNGSWFCAVGAGIQRMPAAPV
jgi:hypothetical protein